MIRMLLAAVLPCLLLGGCVPLSFLEPDGDNSGTTLVPTSSFGNPPAPPAAVTKVAFAPASKDIALRVDRVGREILAANAQIGIRPLFATIGAPEPEVFHQGTSLVHITEGLARQCQSDGQLAAVLCVELGKMVAEREALASPQMRAPEGRPPIDVPIGNAAQFSAPDLTRMAELAPYDQERQRAGKRLPPPDPAALARGYLEKAGHSKADLDAVAPLLAQAERNCALEKQIKITPPGPNWTPQK
jgi:hypothetical protein